MTQVIRIATTVLALTLAIIVATSCSKAPTALRDTKELAALQKSSFNPSADAPQVLFQSANSTGDGGVIPGSSGGSTTSDGGGIIPGEGGSSISGSPTVASTSGSSTTGSTTASTTGVA